MMAAKCVAHERIKSALTIAVARALPDHLTLGVEATLRLTDTVMLEPDLAVFPRELFKKTSTGSPARPRRNPPGDRGRRHEPRLRQGPQAATLCAPPCPRILGGRPQRTHHLGAYRPERRR